MPDVYAATPPLKGMRAILSVAAEHWRTFGMHIDVRRALFHAKAQRLVLVHLRVEDERKNDMSKIGLMRKRMCGTRDSTSKWECD